VASRGKNVNLPVPVTQHLIIVTIIKGQAKTMLLIIYSQQDEDRDNCSSQALQAPANYVMRRQL